MPSFDVVSEFDAHEASNAVDQANREVTNRFDFKGTGSKYELDEQVISLTSQADFRLLQMLEQIKSSKIKVQTSIQGEKLRVSGKKRDDLQAVIALLKDVDIDLPLQYENFRD